VRPEQRSRGKGGCCRASRTRGAAGQGACRAARAGWGREGRGNGSRGVKTALADEDLIRSPSVVDYRSHQR
jgi:hypothetical protein